MRKPFVFIAIAVIFAVAVPSTVLASSRPSVVYTMTITDLGQGCWGGGSLLSDGSTSGNAACAFNNGEDVGLLMPTSWSPIGTGLVSICVQAVGFKGGGFPSGCLVLPVTGTPVEVSLEPGETTLIRVTPVSP